jgi:hypothetical protein
VARPAVVPIGGRIILADKDVVAELRRYQYGDGRYNDREGLHRSSSYCALIDAKNGAHPLG